MSILIKHVYLRSYTAPHRSPAAPRVASGRKVSETSRWLSVSAVTACQKGRKTAIGGSHRPVEHHEVDGEALSASVLMSAAAGSGRGASSTMSSSCQQQLVAMARALLTCCKHADDATTVLCRRCMAHEEQAHLVRDWAPASGFGCTCDGWVHRDALRARTLITLT